MKKEAFQEIARHFAESIKVKLIFEDGATPTTNGTTIILPSEMSEVFPVQNFQDLKYRWYHPPGFYRNLLNV